ncbi:hypothetical protein ACWGJ9_11230 [Curtobacterium citreum]
MHLSHTSAGTDEQCRCPMRRDHHEDDRGPVTIEELRDARDRTEKTLLNAMDAVKEAIRLERVAEAEHREAQKAYTDEMFASFRLEVSGR